MIQRIRRVVTGHDAQGRSVIQSDGPATSVKEIPTFPGHRSPAYPAMHRVR